MIIFEYSKISSTSFDLKLWNRFSSSIKIHSCLKERKVFKFFIIIEKWARTVWSLFMLKTQWNRQEQLEKILCKKSLGWYSWILRVIKVAGCPLKMPCWLSYVRSWPAAAAAGVTVKVRSVQSTKYSWHPACQLQAARLSDPLCVRVHMSVMVSPVMVVRVSGRMWSRV